MTKPRILFAGAILLAAAAAPLFTIPAGAQGSDRAKRIGGKMVCMCGCSQILTQCNHVGCTMSSAMLKELDRTVAKGDSDDLIIQSFVQEYGPAVQAEPPNRGFNRVAWFLPGVTLAAGLALVLFVISRWRRRPAMAAAGPDAPPPLSDEFLSRARQKADRETEE
jgi:cytochrome c-type biogenesis protein CcmH